MSRIERSNEKHSRAAGNEELRKHLEANPHLDPCCQARPTPGPWSYQLNGDYDLRVSGHQLVCHLDFMSEDDGETFANARLIAAAPDLRDALNIMLNAVGNRPNVSLDEAEKCARAALKKARGD